MPQPSHEVRRPLPTLNAFREQVTDLLGGVSLAYALPEAAQLDTASVLPVVPDFPAYAVEREQLAEELSGMRLAVVDREQRLGTDRDVAALGVMLYGPHVHQGTWVRTEVARSLKTGYTPDMGLRFAFSVPGRQPIRISVGPRPLLLGRTIGFDGYDMVPEDDDLYAGLGALSAITKVLSAIER